MTGCRKCRELRLPEGTLVVAPSGTRGVIGKNGLIDGASVRKSTARGLFAEWAGQARRTAPPSAPHAARAIAVPSRKSRAETRDQALLRLFREAKRVE